MKKKKLRHQKNMEALSSLSEKNIPEQSEEERVKRKGIIHKKIGITEIFTDDKELLSSITSTMN